MIVFSEVRLQQIRVIREHLPQHRQQRFVGDNAFPCWLQPANACIFKFGRKHFAQHEFPRIEFEQVANDLILRIRELSALA
ncbi:hypothetical protein D3C78_1097510 [compost metagenome]